MKFYLRDLMWFIVLAAILASAYATRKNLRDASCKVLLEQHYQEIADLRKKHSQAILDLEKKHDQHLMAVYKTRQERATEREVEKRLAERRDEDRREYQEGIFRSLNMPVQPLHMPPVTPKDGAF